MPEEDYIMYVDQSRKEVRRPKTSITRPKEALNIGCWNVRTLYTIGKSAQLAKEMRRYDIDILGISECRWTGYGKVTGEYVLFSGREENLTPPRSRNYDEQESRAIITRMEANKQ